MCSIYIPLHQNSLIGDLKQNRAEPHSKSDSISFSERENGR